MARPVRIGNCSGFYGDRHAAMREMLDDGPLDVLTGDYLAELTMLILARSRLKDPAAGFASGFLRQLEDCLGLVVEHGVRLVVNAGGLNPGGCAERVRALAARLGFDLAVAHVTGDDLMPRVTELGLPADALTANAYLGCWGMVECLRAGAQIVITGRVTDASLVVGPAAWWHGWARTDWDRLAGATVVGHILECGAQATGGNYAFFAEVPGLEHVGFPLAELAEDGTAVVTKHPGTGGLVVRGTVTAQLLYEIAGPHYLGPDVTTDFSTIRLDDGGPDRVRVSGVRGGPPPATTKVCVNTVGGLRNAMTFVLTGLDVEAKAALVRRQLEPVLSRVREADVRLARTDHEDPETTERASALLTITVKDADPARVGRQFSSAAVEIALASYPGCTLTAPPGDGTPYGVFHPAYVPNEAVWQEAMLPDGTTVAVPPLDEALASAHPAQTTAPTGAGAPRAVTGSRGCRRVPLGAVFGARSGDKGADANVGIWARSEEAYTWLADQLDVPRLQALLPETVGLEVERYLLPNLRAVNFVIRGLLGEGVASSPRFDPQAKGLGEWLRSRIVELPAHLVDTE